MTGPTAVLKSVSRMDDSFTTNGGLLNMKFLPEFFRTQTGRDKFEHFLRAFVDLEIPHIQFNVVNREDLIDAQIHPERHQSLTVQWQAIRLTSPSWQASSRTKSLNAPATPISDSQLPLR